MKRFTTLVSGISIILFTSCVKDYDEPLSNLNEAKTNSEVILADAAWFEEYERLMFEENKLIELFAREALSEEDLGTIHESINSEEFSQELFKQYLTESEYRRLLEYFSDLENHFASVTFTEAQEITFQKIHEKGISSWKSQFPSGHFLFEKASDCEEEAALAATAVLTSTIAASAAGVIFTGGLSVVAGVVGGAAASVTTWLVMSANC